MEPHLKTSKSTSALPYSAGAVNNTSENSAAEICPLCKRSLGVTNVDEHHLIPRTFKGRLKVSMHRICHRKIHATFSERELYNHYHTFDRLLENELIQTFVKWVQRKDPSFYDVSVESNERRGKRKR